MKTFISKLVAVQIQYNNRKGEKQLLLKNLVMLDTNTSLSHDKPANNNVYSAMLAIPQLSNMASVYS